MHSGCHSIFHNQSFHQVFISTHGQKGNPFIAAVPNGAGCPWVKHRTAIHKEHIFMMAMRKLEAGHPATIGHPLHWIHCGLPVIEVPDEAHLLRVRRVAEKINVVAAPIRRIGRRAHVLLTVKHLVVHFSLQVRGLDSSCSNNFVIKMLFLSDNQDFAGRMAFHIFGIASKQNPLERTTGVSCEHD